MLSVRAAGHQGVALAARQAGDGLGQPLQIAQHRRMGLLDLEHEARIGHVLGGRTPVHVATRVAFA